jgi:hypothetical protein
MADRVATGPEVKQIQIREPGLDGKSIDELRTENAELRELVVQLTKIIARNVVDRR